LTGNRFAKADAALGGLKHQLLGLAGAALAGFGLKELIDGTSQLAASVDDASHSIGIDTDALQELSYAAKLSGTDTEGLKQGITILSRTMYDASQGGKETAKSFADVGVAITDANGNLRPAEDVMGDLADHFASLPDAATKTALSMKFFGRSGATLIPLMNEGSKGMADMRQEAGTLAMSWIKTLLRPVQGLMTISIVSRWPWWGYATPSAGPYSNRSMESFPQWSSGFV
jgi:hypothetical protein